MVTEISTERLAEVIGDGRYRIIDARRIDAYNGWCMKGEARGGHIRGAKSIPAAWSQQEDWPQIIRSKGITSVEHIVVYGYTDDEIQAVADRFSAEGYPEVGVYTGFVDEWCANSDLPMERLENYHKLVYPEWVEKLVSGKKPPGFSGDKFAICHCHYRNRADYDLGHIPGAVAVDTLELESPGTWNRRSPEELMKALTKMGITADTTVVVYGRFSFPRNEDPHPGSSAGHLGAFRCAVIMIYAGVKDVRILNGGIASWGERGYALSREENRLEPVDDFGVEAPARPEIFIDTPEARQVLASPGDNLISVRSWNEFVGKVSGYNYILKKGRIPGAVFGNCGSDAYHMENYRNMDLTTREYHEVEDMWRGIGITPDRFNAFYCGTGWRASEAFMNAYLMGWKNIAVYDGGWFEWSNDPGNPIEKGEPK
ncbi:MAG: thiosulfate sulfurtransferase [Deltaproteobacteria bacterium]|nr:thiosulfate sulfurtransferase [Deltaproteobacteria bacterium]